MVFNSEQTAIIRFYRETKQRMINFSELLCEQLAILCDLSFFLIVFFLIIHSRIYDLVIIVKVESSR